MTRLFGFDKDDKLEENKLKTLKDIDKEYTDYNGDCEQVNLKDRLKAEAVKWVKDLADNWYKLHSLKQELEGEEALNYCETREQINWIKHFFNLTEKDLGEQEK